MNSLLNSLRKIKEKFSDPKISISLESAEEYTLLVTSKKGKRLVLIPELSSNSFYRIQEAIPEIASPLTVEKSLPSLLIDLTVTYSNAQSLEEGTYPTTFEQRHDGTYGESGTKMTYETADRLFKIGREHSDSEMLQIVLLGQLVLLKFLVMKYNKNPNLRKIIRIIDGYINDVIKGRYKLMRGTKSGIYSLVKVAN